MSAVQIQISDLAGARTGVANIDSETAWALAQFVKRASWTTCERLSVDKDQVETQRMMDGICAIQRALRDAGIAPR